MGANVFPVDAVTGAPSYTGRMLRQTTVAPFVAIGTTARPLGAKSGIRPGTPSSIVSVVSGTWTVHPFAGVIDGESLAIAGPYGYSFDSDQSGGIGASGSAARVDRLDVQISDPAESDGSSVPAITIIRTQGAATGGATPAAPARSHKLCLINVPVSGAPTVSWAPDWLGDPGEWQFNTLAELTAYVTLIGSANVPVAQKAAVIADTTSGNNGGYVWNGSAMVRDLPQLPHAEYTTSVTGLTDGNGFAAHTFAADATLTTDSSFSSVVSSAVRLQPGIYLIDWFVILSAIITGTTVLQIQVNGTGVQQISVGTQTASGGVTLPGILVVAANTDIKFVVNKTTSGGCNVGGRVRVTKIA